MLPRWKLAAGGRRSLEAYAAPDEAPDLATAILLEAGPMRARLIAQPRAPEFAAFLDGIQHSEVLDHDSGYPVVHATVAAVIRERLDRRLTTWAHDAEHLIAAPKALISNELREALERLELDIADTSQPRDGKPIVPHPFVLRDAAIHVARHRRARLERRLAERWCDQRGEPLFVDGGISGSDTLAAAHQAIGVVKSHRILYAKDDALHVVLGLAEGERSSVFRIEPQRRAPVASWYLRIRDAERRGPFWGLVRVEVSEKNLGGAGDVSERADVVSAWILAEVAPLALPDSRWHAMVYGIRDCEEFLRAVTV